MTTLELTDEQARELKYTIDCEIERLDGYIASYGTGDPDRLRCINEKSALSDILHLLGDRLMPHTPGPWYNHMLLSVACENDGEYGDATCITNTPEEEYASAGVSGDWIAFVPHDRNHAANAALIAAAPELLSVSRMAFDYAQDTKARFAEYFDSDDAESYDNLCDACEKAIAKAEGGGE